MTASTSRLVRSISATHNSIVAGAVDAEAPHCCECFGTGIVQHWNEVAFFEDRRACTRCEAGGRFDETMAEIVKRAYLAEHLSRR